MSTTDFTIGDDSSSQVLTDDDHLYPIHITELRTAINVLETVLDPDTSVLTSPVITSMQINDTTADHQYVFAVSELTADRTVTLPLLTGNDEFVFKAHTQTLTNKTLTSPAVTNLTGSLNSPVLTTPQIEDSSANHQYIFAVSELTADRTTTLPLLTGNDTFVFKDHTQTLTNKTLTTPTLTTPKVDTINEETTAAGVTIDGVLLKDSIVNTDAITALTTEHITLTPGTSKLVKVAALQQDDTTDTYKNNTVILTGWGYITGDASIDLNETVTFGVTFAGNGPIVIISGMGHAGNGAAPDGIDDFGGSGMAIVGSVNSITTTTFVANIYYTGTTFTSGYHYGYTWIAIGVLA